MDFNFRPRLEWPKALPAISWKGQLLTGFNRPPTAPVIDVWELQRPGLVDTIKGCYTELGLSELARLSQLLTFSSEEMFLEIREALFLEYGLRWSDRLDVTLKSLLKCPSEFQEWVDDKKISVRDLSPLLALQDVEAFAPFLRAMTDLLVSRSEGVRMIELGVELFLLDRPLNDLLPSGNDGAKYLRQLETWRKPTANSNDETWRAKVQKWPWPSHVKGEWQRFGDESGVEVKFRAKSAQDLMKKIEGLKSISDTWSCND